MTGRWQPRRSPPHAVTLPVAADPTGRDGPTRRQAAGAGWRRTSRGRYVPAEVVVTPAQRVAEAGVLLPTGAALTGWAALCWLGARWHTGRRADGDVRPVDVVGSDRTIRDQPLLRVHRGTTDPDTHVEVDGVRVTSAVEAVVFEMRYAASLDHAVEALDMTYEADLVTPYEVLAWVEAHPGLTGIATVRAALRWADENTWSPQETHLRLAWQRLIGRRPLANRPLHDQDGRFLGTPDLVDPDHGVTGEYDGDGHLDRAQRRRDLAREQRLTDAGLRTFTVVAGDLRSGAFESRLHSTYSRPRQTHQGWTLDLPAGRPPTVTVSQRRDLDTTELAIWSPRHRR